MTTLTELKALLDGAHGPSRELFWSVGNALLQPGAIAAADIDNFINAGAYTDAAKALVECKLPGWEIAMDNCRDREPIDVGWWGCELSRSPYHKGDVAHGVAPTLDLALLKALVAALIELGDGK